MSEWSKEHDWKSCNGKNRSGVQIPLSPPKEENRLEMVFDRQITPNYRGYLLFRL